MHAVAKERSEKKKKKKTGLSESPIHFSDKGIKPATPGTAGQRPQQPTHKPKPPPSCISIFFLEFPSLLLNKTNYKLRQGTHNNEPTHNKYTRN